MPLGRVGIIGGTGLETALGGLGSGEDHLVDTPFGKPSGPIRTTEIGGVPVALLARHGPGHRFNPSQVPYRANLFALKTLGVTHVLASGAVGSLREEIAPKHLVVPDQLIDRTHRRASTFFDDVVVHVEMASPFCPTLRSSLIETGRSSSTSVHAKGTLVVMEGPQFSTRAESELHRSWGADLIGMTAMPEAKLAREAELCYAMIALPTDYDCWRPAREEVDAVHVVQEVLSNIREATANAMALLKRVLPLVRSDAHARCRCQESLSLAVWTDRAAIAPEVLSRLAPLLGRALR